MKFGLTSKLRHSHRSLTLAAMMIIEFHKIVELTSAVAVACSGLILI
jgi:hypothetical protein